MAYALDEQSWLVSYINLGTGINQSFFLEDVIISYGFPDEVQIEECRPAIMAGGHCVVLVIYRQSGMALELYLPGDSEHGWKVTVLPNVEVYRIYFFPQDADNLEMIHETEDSISPIVPWKGYAEYP